MSELYLELPGYPGVLPKQPTTSFAAPESEDLLQKPRSHRALSLQQPQTKPRQPIHPDPSRDTKFDLNLNI